MTDRVWQPPTREIDPVEKAVVDAARHTVLPLAGIGVPAPDGDGVIDITLADGRRLRLRLAAQPVASGSRHGRAVVEFQVSGHGLLEDAAFAIEGRAVLDTATRAFLDVRLDLGRFPVGRARPTERETPEPRELRDRR